MFSSLAAENERIVRAVGKADFMQYLDFLAALVVLERCIYGQIQYSLVKNNKAFFVTMDVLPHFSWRRSNVEVFRVLGFWCLTCCAGTSECSESCTLRLFGVRFC